MGHLINRVFQPDFHKVLLVCHGKILPEEFGYVLGRYIEGVSQTLEADVFLVMFIYVSQETADILLILVWVLLGFSFPLPESG